MLGAQHLVERALETAAVDRAIALAGTGAGQLLLLEGQPGLGKTCLADVAEARCLQAGMLVLRAAGAEIERDLGWGVVRSLFGRELANLARRDQLLHGAANAAAPVFGAGAPDGGAAGAIMHGLYWLVSDLAADGPLAIIVDDFHWADAPSERWLSYLGARLEDLPVLVVLSARPVPSARIWQGLATSPASTVLSLRPLSPAGALALLTRGLGDTAEGMADACHEVTGGNPFLVCELMRHLGTVADGVITAEHVRRLAPDSIRRSVLVALAQLGADATELAFAIAILGRQASLSLAAELAGLERATAARCADALEAEGVITIGDKLGFAHPIVLGVVNSEIPRAKRAEWHRHAAEMLRRRGVNAGGLAPHLLATEPEGRAEVVQTLRAAAAEAVALGAPEVAASCLARALAEPPAETELADVLLALGEAESTLADGAGVERLRVALSHSVRPDQRARIARSLAAQLLVRGELEEALSLCRAAALDLPESERELRLELLAQEWILAGQSLLEDPNERLAVDPRQLGGASRAERLLLAVTANVRLTKATTPMGPLREMAMRALQGDTLLEDVGAESPSFWAAAMTVMFGEDYDEVSRLIEAAIADSRRRGSARGYGLALCFRAALGGRLGRLAESAEDARRAIELFAEEPLTRSYAQSFLVDALVEQGALSEASAALEGVELSELPPVVAFAMVRGSAARLALARGDARGAATELLEVARELADVSPVIWRARAECAIALHAAGDLERARAFAGEAVRLSDLAGSRWVRTHALYAHGVIEGSLEPLEQAEALTRGWPTRLERARVLAELGAALRRRGRTRDAEPFLREALELADLCGAIPIVERAREELRIATGARPRRSRRSGVHSLTPSELRVCRMAVEGQTNREIAQALFVSLRTIETHLTRAYQKLGIGARGRLPAALAEDAGPADALALNGALAWPLESGASGGR